MTIQGAMADQMIKLIKDDANKLAALKNDPISQIPKLVDEAARSAPAYYGDKVLYRIAVGVLGSLAVIAAAGSIALVLLEKQTPEVLVALGSAAVGALVGLFAPAPTGK